MAPYSLPEMNAYGLWQAQDGLANPYRMVADRDELQSTGSYRMLTPAEFLAEQADSPLTFLVLHPMCGVIPPDLAWSSLKLFEREVLPHVQ